MHSVLLWRTSAFSLWLSHRLLLKPVIIASIFAFFEMIKWCNQRVAYSYRFCNQGSHTLCSSISRSFHFCLQWLLDLLWNHFVPPSIWCRSPRSIEFRASLYIYGTSTSWGNDHTRGFKALRPKKVKFVDKIADQPVHLHFSTYLTIFLSFGKSHRGLQTQVPKNRNSFSSRACRLYIRVPSPPFSNTKGSSKSNFIYQFAFRNYQFSSA